MCFSLSSRQAWKDSRHESESVYDFLRSKIKIGSRLFLSYSTGPRMSKGQHKKQILIWKAKKLQSTRNGSKLLSTYFLQSTFMTIFIFSTWRTPMTCPKLHKFVTQICLNPNTVLFLPLYTVFQLKTEIDNISQSICLT